jgi:hypothetical protein
MVEEGIDRLPADPIQEHRLPPMSIGPGGYAETLRSTFTVVKAVPQGLIIEGLAFGAAFPFSGPAGSWPGMRCHKASTLTRCSGVPRGRRARPKVSLGRTMPSSMLLGADQLME